MSEIATNRPLLKQIVVDNGPEFTSRALDQWACEHDVELSFIRPGRSVENCFFESCNGKFRDECLNFHWLTTLDDGRAAIEEWRFDDNRYRPYSSLGRKPPVEIAEQSVHRPATSASVLIAPATETQEGHQPSTTRCTTEMADLRGYCLSIH